MYVCICKAITDSQVRAATRDGACTLDELRDGLGVATGCGQCAVTVCEMLRGNEATGGTSGAGHDAGFAAV